MEVWRKFEFNSAEYKVWEIYKAYESHVRKRGDYRKYLPTKTDPRTGKNWTYFQQVYDTFAKDTVFDPYIFIEAQFRNVPKDKSVFPAQLKTKVAIQKYHDHRDALKVNDSTDETERIMENLAATFRLLKKWWKQHDLPMDSYRQFFTVAEGETMSDGMLFCLQGMISKYFMSVSKHFLREYNDLDSDMKWEIINPNDLKSYRIKLKYDENAYSFAKQVYNGELL